MAASQTSQVSASNIIPTINETESLKTTPQPPAYLSGSIKATSGTQCVNSPLATSVYSVNSPSVERKHDYSNCISQLQSAAAQAISSTLPAKMNANGVTCTAAAKPNAMTDLSPGPVLFRNSKFNQSLNSSHSNSNINNQQVLNSFLVKLNEGTSSNVNAAVNSQPQQAVFSTFKDLNSPTTACNNMDNKKRKFSHWITFFIANYL